MLIASLERLQDEERNTIAYAASDPCDGELLTTWHGTIMQVQQELEENDSDYGLMTACYQGESDVPARPRNEDAEKPEGNCGFGPGTALPCF